MRGIEHMPRLYDAAMAVMELFGLRKARRWLASGVSGHVLLARVSPALRDFSPTAAGRVDRQRD